MVSSKTTLGYKKLASTDPGSSTPITGLSGWSTHSVWATAGPAAHTMTHRSNATRSVLMISSHS
jgi:hypothetical protein